MSEKDTLRGKSSSLCEANPQAARTPKVEASALVEELRDRVRSLERRLDEERESRRRADTSIAQLTQAKTALAAGCRRPSETRNEADMVHTTLFRYRGALCDPQKLLAMLEETSAFATAEVEELVVSKELVYPSLEAEVLGRLPLSSR